ncbi:MAG: hypothetical protein JRM82_02520 [Nitrososphaerota archaeon]|nr:hypothetical protein [Nitrososphaerota archaeon]
MPERLGRHPGTKHGEDHKGADAYEEWLKRQPATPSTRGQKDRVEADVYEAWLRQRIERKRPRR